jgi:serine/threonine protein kinase
LVQIIVYEPYGTTNLRSWTNRELERAAPRHYEESYRYSSLFRNKEEAGGRKRDRNAIKFTNGIVVAQLKGTMNGTSNHTDVSGISTVHSNILREFSKGNVFEKYEVTEVIGEGSIGAVCKVRIRPKKVGGSAFNPKKDRGLFGGFNLLNGLKRKKEQKQRVSEHSQEYLYALKSIQLARVTPDFLEELQNEIRILRSLDHPHIVRAHEGKVRPDLMVECTHFPAVLVPLSHIAVLWLPSI